MKMHLVFIIPCILLTACMKEAEYKPMKYMRNGEELSCTAQYIDNKIYKIICFSSNRDTILVDNCIDGKRNGTSTRWHESGFIMERGEFKNNAKVGIWHEYFDDGRIKAFKYYRLLNGLSQLYYEKIYDQKGDLVALTYPLVYRTNSDSIFIVGSKYQLFVDLKYSEFDSVNIAGIVQDVHGTLVHSDTVKYFGNTLYFEFIPEQAGGNYIEGLLVELNGNKSEIDKGYYGGDRPFRFDYVAKDY